jgi:sulfur relay (sulfurtransferase) complex TusBCD TusD component (DsrE family)
MSEQNAPPVAIVIFSTTETAESNSRVINAFMTAKEIIEAGGEVEVIFDGKGVESAVQLADPAHQMHRLYSQVQEHITGVCKFCSRSYGVLERAEELGIHLIDEWKQHPSLYKRIKAGVQILTF